MTRPTIDLIAELVPHDTLRVALRPLGDGSGQWRAWVTLNSASGLPCPVWQEVDPGAHRAVEGALRSLYSYLISPAGEGMRRG